MRKTLLYLKEAAITILLLMVALSLFCFTFGYDEFRWSKLQVEAKRSMVECLIRLDEHKRVYLIQVEESKVLEFYCNDIMSLSAWRAINK